MTLKTYTQSEEDRPVVSEPQAVYGFSADHLRMEMMREALCIDDTELLRDALNYIRALVKPQHPPCQYTLAELNKRLDMAEEEDRQGVGCTTEELRKRHPR